MAVGSSNDFDLVVLGAGTGGYTAAFRAGQLGLKVALVDEDKIGGTCLHRGCIPTKALLESAAFAERVRHAKDFGLVAARRRRSSTTPAMAARRDAVVKRLWTGLKTLIDKNKVTWVAGRGRLDGPGKVRVSQAGEDGTPGQGRRPRPQGDRRDPRDGLAGQVAARASTPDGKRIVTSDDVLQMDTLPKDIVIVGAGAVGVEFASMYHDLGVKVTLLEYLPADRAARGRARSARSLERSFTKRGITVMTNARFDPASVTADEGRRLPDGRARGQGAGRAPRRADARRDRPGREHRGHRPRDDEGRDRPGLRSRSTAGCGRRSRTSTRSATSSAGCCSPTPRPRGHHRRAHDRRRRGRPRRSTTRPSRGRPTAGRRSPRSG